MSEFHDAFRGRNVSCNEKCRAQLACIIWLMIVLMIVLDKQ